MKTFYSFFATFFFFFCGSFSVAAQCTVEAGTDQTITCEGSAQLYAEPSVGLWETSNTGITALLNSIYFVTENIGFTVGSSGLISKTTDGGQTWVSQNSGTTNNLQSIKFFDENTGYAVGGSSTALKTTNGGESWTTLKLTGTNSFKSIYFLSENTVFILGSAGQLLKTVDGGQNWTTQTINPLQAYYDITFQNSNTGYICGSGGAIYKTIDGGNNWLIQKNSSTNTLLSISFATDNVGCAVGPFGTIVKTVDGGSTWNMSVGDSIYSEYGNNIFVNGYPIQNSILNSIHFISSNTGYVTGYSGVMNEAFVLKTFNGGETWKVDVRYPSTKLFWESFLNSGTGFVCGASGFISKRNATNASDSYSWYPTTGLSNPNIANPIANPVLTTTYTVTKLNNGCVESDQMTVYIEPLSVNAGTRKTIGCEGSVQLDSVRSNYAGKGKLKYKWTPAIGLNSDTISNPIATTAVSKTYSVTITSPSGCTATGNVIVDVAPLTANTGIYKAITCGATVQLDAVKTNYSGIGTLHYKWTPTAGLNNDTIANPIASPKTTTTYTVTVTSQSGCTASSNYYVSVGLLTVNAGTDKTTICGMPVQLDLPLTNYTGTTPVKYKWTPATGLNNDTVPNPIATVNNNTIYKLTVTSPSGCTAVDNVSVRVTTLSTPILNYIGVNEKNKNRLVWTKPVNGKVSLYNVYKETNVTNTFAKIGSVDADSTSAYVDTLSFPDVQSNKYKISIVDECSNETPLSDYHKTMHLSINRGINTSWNLIWESYIGFSVSTYNIYRGITAENIQLIGSLSGSNTQFTDYSAPAGNVYYQIEAVSTNANNAPQQNKSAVKTSALANFSSRSNIATNVSGTGLFDVKDISGLISIYPNPASNKIELTINENVTAGTKVNIYNITGSIVKTQEISEKKHKITLDNLTNGIYLLVVTSDKFTGKQKLIIQK